MENIAHNVLELIGNTPMMVLEIFREKRKWKIFAKLECLNPSGSVKDRIAKYIIEKAEERGELKKDSIIVEATSGNTGIGLTMVSAVKGYSVIIVMPEHMSLERRKIMLSLGAKICLTPKEESFAGAREKTLQMASKDKRVFLTRQFENLDNIDCHYETTGQEIIKQMEYKKIDAFIDGVGTGGTLMGVGKALKEIYPDCMIVAVEPAEAAILSGETEMHEHKIAGIGDGFIPELLDIKCIDEVVRIKSDDAVEMAKIMSKKYGLLIGISSGANILASIEILKKIGEDKSVVTVLPDRSERYFSTDLFSGREIQAEIRECIKNCENPFCDILIEKKD